MPDSSYKHLPPSRCFDQPHGGNPEALSLVNIDMGFDVELATLPGRYTYVVNAQDAMSRRSVSVEASIDVVAGVGP